MSLLVQTDQEHTPRSPASSTETFTDANTSGLLHPALGNGSVCPAPTSDSWPAELSTSFASIAEQLQNASRTLAAHAAANHLAALAVRVDAIERTQERLAGELAVLRNLHADKSGALLHDAAVASSASSKSTTADLERRLADMLATQKLEYVHAAERERSVCWLTHAFQPGPPLRAPAELACNGGKDAYHGVANRVWQAADGPPEDQGRVRAPHQYVLLTWEAGCSRTSSAEERYEGLLQAYDQPIEGDTAAKREALRIFLGLPA